MNQTEKDVKPTDEAVDVEQAANEDMKIGGNEEAPSLVPGEEEGAADARGNRAVKCVECLVLCHMS